MSTNVAASIRARLHTKAKERGIEIEFESFLVRYACERFLYRLGESPVRDHCILKGATLLAIWMKEPYRATRDIDLLAFGNADETSIREVMATICKVPCPEDGLTFDLNNLRISPIHSEQMYPGQRVRLTCYLGKAEIPTQVDFGFGDIPTSGPEEAQLQTLIDGVPAPSLRVYPLATSVAEKFEAMVQLEWRNSRMKDFHDVWALSDQFPFDGKELREAIQDCFERRGTDWTSEIPVALTSAFYSDTDQNTWWSNYRRKKELMTPPPETFDIVGERMLKFLAPIRDSILADAPFHLHWPAGGPWQRLKPYPVYKDSGVEWLGEIPTHWEIIRLKQASRIQGGFAFSTDSFRSEGIPVVRMNNIRRGVLDLDDVVRIPEHKGKDAFALNEGDIIYGLSGSIGATGSLGNYAVVRKGDTPAQLNQRVARFRPVIDRITEKFIVGSLQTSVFYEQVLSYTTGTAQFNVSTNDIGNVVLALPPIKEQRAIDAFLDRETEPINTLVAKKERLIERLQEKRTALISHAVSKGLDPDVPLKDSGVEWLGEIPAHWEVKRLKHLATVNDEALPETTDPDMEIAYVDIGNVDSIQGITDVEELVFEEAPSRARRIVRQGDVIISTVRTYLRAIAQIEATDANLIVSTGFAVIRPRQIDDGFVAYAVNAPYFVERVVAHSVGVSYPAINASELACLDIAFPSLPEQRAIAAFLDRETEPIDALVAKVQEAIDRLKELRTALISAAVTGKIDVREAAA